MKKGLATFGALCITIVSLAAMRYLSWRLGLRIDGPWYAILMWVISIILVDRLAIKMYGEIESMEGGK